MKYLKYNSFNQIFSKKSEGKIKSQQTMLNQLLATVSTY